MTTLARSPIADRATGDIELSARVVFVMGPVGEAAPVRAVRAPRREPAGVFARARRMVARIAR